MQLAHHIYSIIKIIMLVSYHCYWCEWYGVGALHGDRNALTQHNVHNTMTLLLYYVSCALPEVL